MYEYRAVIKFAHYSDAIADKVYRKTIKAETRQTYLEKLRVFIRWKQQTLRPTDGWDHKVMSR